MSFPINDQCCGESAKGVNNCVWKRSHIRIGYLFWVLLQIITDRKESICICIHVHIIHKKISTNGWHGWPSRKKKVETIFDII